MQTCSDVSSGARTTHGLSSRPTRNLHPSYQQDHRSSARSGSISSASLLGLADCVHSRPDPATRIEPRHGDDYTWSRTPTASPDSSITGFGAQFQTVPRSKCLPGELEIATRSPPEKYSRNSIPIIVSESLESPAACKRCMTDKQKCLRQESTLHKQSTKCQRCILFNYNCDSPAKPAGPHRKTSVAKPPILPARATGSAPALKAVPFLTRHDKTKHLAVDVLPPETFDKYPKSIAQCTEPSKSSQEVQVSTTNNEYELPWLTKILFKLAIPHSTHHDQPCPLSTVLSTRVQALIKQIPGSEAIVGGSTFVSITSAKGAGRSYPQQGSSQTPDSDSESDQEDSGDEDDEDSPHDGKAIQEGTTQQTIACPLAKNQRYLHDHPECHRCLTATLRKMTTVVQHMKRTHNFCFTCCREFASQKAFSNHVPKKRHCKKCHRRFKTLQKLDKHRSKKCREPDKRDDKQRWDAIWRYYFGDEPPPASYDADHIPTLQEESEFVGWIRGLPENCRAQIRRDIEQHGTMGNTERESEILDRVLGQVTERPNTSGNASDSFHSDMNAARPTANPDVSFPTPITGTPISSIASQESRLSHQPFSLPQQGLSMPQVQQQQYHHHQHFMQPVYGHNPPYPSTSFPNTHEIYSVFPNESYEWLHQGQFAAQPQFPAHHQSSAQDRSQFQPRPAPYANMPLPNQPLTHNRGVHPGMNPQPNYFYHSPPLNQHHQIPNNPTAPENLELCTPRSIPQVPTSLMPGSYRSDVDTTTIPDQGMSAGHPVNPRSYCPQVQ